MNTSFLNREKPLLTNMIQTYSAEQAIITATNALYEGAEAFGLQGCYLKPEYRTPDTYRKIFAAMKSRPIYVTSYRRRYNEGFSDEACMEYLLELLDAGATLGDVMGDTYDPTPGELTYNSDAIDRQKELIERIHFMGKEVLMSSHVHEFRSADQVLEIAMAHQDRGADIAKIVTGAHSEEQQLENLRITNLLKKELRIPFLFLSNGSHCGLHRVIGTALGNSMCLCAYQHDELSTKSQPVLRVARQILDGMRYL